MDRAKRFIQEGCNRRGLSHRAATGSKERLEKHLWQTLPASHERFWEWGRRTRAKQKRNQTKKEAFRKAESEPHSTHPGSEGEECGCSRETKATDRRRDVLPNKAANLGDSVSMCWTLQQATADVSTGGQNAG